MTNKTLYDRLDEAQEDLRLVKQKLAEVKSHLEDTQKSRTLISEHLNTALGQRNKFKADRDALWRILHRFIEALTPEEEDVESDHQLADDFRVAYPSLVKDARKLLKELEAKEND